jgi:hypothetical protein
MHDWMGQHLFPSTKLAWRHFRKMERVLNGYLTNPNPTPILTPNPKPNCNSNQINKNIKKKRL